MQPAPGDVLVHARILGWLEDGGLPVDLGLVEEDDCRARTWDPRAMRRWAWGELDSALRRNDASGAATA